MARRNRKSRNSRTPKDVKPTNEELKQEKSFFVWTGIITLVVVVLLYFLMIS